MKKNVVQTSDAPRPIGPYSQAIRVSGGVTVYLSGQIGLNPATMEMAASVEEQAQQVFSNPQGGGCGQRRRPERYCQTERLFNRSLQL